MSAFATADEFEKHNPLVRFSFYANGRVQVLLKLGVEILGELEAAFPDDSSVSFEHLARAEELSWLWILGAYEVVRTMCQAKPCFSERAHKSLSNLKRELGRVRMPAAKMEAPGQPVPIESSRSAAGLSASERDLLVGDPSNPKSLRNLIGAFYSVFSQIDGSGILATHESVYGAVKANPAVHRTLRDKPRNGSIVSGRLMAAFSRCDSHIAPRSFESLALVIGAKERRFMSAKIKYTDEPLGKPQVVADFLPSPSELAFREEGVKVTLALSKKSIEFFKSEATKHHTQYQRMIRRLLDSYVDAHALTLRSSGTRQKRRAP